MWEETSSGKQHQNRGVPGVQKCDVNGSIKAEHEMHVADGDSTAEVTSEDPT